MKCCALCCLDLPRHPYGDGTLSFCCIGCRTVYQILETQNALSNYEEAPIFQQALQSGLISNPALLEQIRKKKPQVNTEDLQRLHLEVGNMWCPSCAEVIKLVLLQEKGVMSCVVDYSTDLAAVEYSPRHIGKERIIARVKSFGYEAGPLEDKEKRKVSLALYLRFAVAAFCALNLMMMSYPLYLQHLGFDALGYVNRGMLRRDLADLMETDGI